MSPSFASCTRLGEPSPKWPRILPNGRFIIGWPAWFQFYSGSFSGWIPFSRISNFYGLRIINYCGWKKSCTIVDHRHPIMGCLPPFSTGDLDFATIHSIFHVFSLWSPIPLCFFCLLMVDGSFLRVRPEVSELKAEARFSLYPFSFNWTEFTINSQQKWGWWILL